MARLRARTYASLIGIGTPILLAGVLWWFRRQGGQAAPSDQLFALVIGSAMLGTAGILLGRSLPTLAASLALLVLGFPQEILGSVILPSGGLYLIAAFIVGLTDVGEMVGEGIEAGKEGMEESGMRAPEMPSAFQDATDGGETGTADTPETEPPGAPGGDALDAPEQPVPDTEAPEGPAQPVEADDVEPITADDGADATDDADSTAPEDDADETSDPEEVGEEHGPHHAPEVQVDQDRVHADDPSVGQIGGDDGETDGSETDDSVETDDPEADESDGSETEGRAEEESADDDESGVSESTADTESGDPTGNRGTRAERPDPEEARNWSGTGEDSVADGADETDEATTPTGTPVERPENVDPPDEPGGEAPGPVDPEPFETDETDDHGHPEPVRSVEPAGEESADDREETAGDDGADDADETAEDEKQSS